MTNEQSVFNDGSLDEINFINFDKDVHNNTLNLRFLGDEPTVKTNQFGSTQWSFEVQNMDTKHIGVHTITSKGYMRTLGKFTPLGDKVFCIQKTGEKMDTIYNVTLVSK